MLTADLRAALGKTIAASDALQMTCRMRQNGWRGEVVRLRRVVASEMGRMVALAVEAEPQGEALRALRHHLSGLRFAVADLQASWPAVSLDPEADSYRASVRKVVSCLEQVDQALAACERDGRVGAARSTQWTARA